MAGAGFVPAFFTYVNFLKIKLAKFWKKLLTQRKNSVIMKLHRANRRSTYDEQWQSTLIIEQ